ncbi:MAG: sigma-70 family RNA polymerase sigma factor [Acidobacteriia bacterium]|nr:sigma-70 family RNA polymerase sigma factor [Terriglobia bacterium]
MQELALLMEAGSVDARDEEFVRFVKQAKAGDRAAFEAILIRYQRQVLVTALRLLNRNLEDAKDAAQQVFLRLYRSLHQLDENRHFASWLYRITVNVCRDMQRAGSRRPILSLEEGEGLVAAAGEDLTERNEQRRMIYAALATLPERERTAVVLRDLEGLTTSEVARIMECAEVTVRSQISNARVKIRKFVERRQRRPL